MPIGDPSIVFNGFMKSATKNQKFALLSPQTQAALQQVANYPPGSTLRQADLANNPQLQAAIKEAQTAGVIDNTPLWQELLKGTAIAGGVAAAGPLLGSIGGGGGAGELTGTATDVSAAPIGASAGAGPLAAGETFAAGPIAGTGLAGVDTAGMVGTSAAGTGFGAALKAALPTIIGAGATLGGAAIASSGNTKAAQIAADQAQKTLDQAKLIFQQQRADLAPYRGEGVAALGPLNFGLGLPPPTTSQGPFDTSTGPQGTTVGMPTTTGPIVAAGAKDAQGNPLPNAGQNQVIPNPPTPAQTMGTLSTVGGGGTVRIQDPATGLVHLVPQGQAAAAQQAGGRLV